MYLNIQNGANKKTYTLTNAYAKASDVSGDGQITAIDYSRIKLFNSWNIRAQNETNEISDVYCSLIIIFHT